MSREGIFKADNATVVILAAAFLLLFACVPLALGVDQRIDRDRPMYGDLSRMTALQDLSVAGTGSAVPVELSDGESAEVAGTEFVASDGVTVVVRDGEGDAAYCVLVRNEHGSESERCG